MPLAVQEVANRYEIISLIGQGGMADVYKAKDIILNRIVAIKILREKLSHDAMTLVRFQREASAASRLSHPNVVDIYDVGESDGMHYIVMEFIRGRTLKQLIQQRGALSVSESIQIMTQLTSAIDHAHKHNIIHRDIKPQNVLVKDDGTVKITDFGIAIANDAVQLTLNNAVMGSAHYLAPETAQGKEPTAQVDIYSLGIVFYELLTGDVPFHGKTPTEIAVKHLRQPIPYVRDFNPAIPQAVENIILKATAKDPKDRYSSAYAMLEDLQNCMNWEMRNVERISFTTPNIAKVDVNDGHVEVEYSDEPIETEEKRKFPWFTWIIRTIVILIVCLILLLGLVASHVIQVDGLLGYQTIPNVVNLSTSQAKKKLKAKNFTHITIKKVLSDSVDKGQVISCNYDAGQSVYHGNTIVLKVSKGPGYLVEDFTGQTLEEAEYTLDKEGVKLNIEVKYKNAADTNPGVILSQKKLKAGTRIDPNANETIQFVVSQNPTIVIPESLIGMDVNEAKESLNDQGIAVVLSGSGDTGVVVNVSPSVGSTYTQEGSDSVVTLYYQ